MFLISRVNFVLNASCITAKSDEQNYTRGIKVGNIKMNVCEIAIKKISGGYLRNLEALCYMHLSFRWVNFSIRRKLLMFWNVWTLIPSIGREREEPAWACFNLSLLDENHSKRIRGERGVLFPSKLLRCTAWRSFIVNRHRAFFYAASKGLVRQFDVELLQPGLAPSTSVIDTGAFPWLFSLKN